jgi:hypothetical protein
MLDYQLLGIVLINELIRKSISNIYISKAKSVALHTMKALGWRGEIAPSHS